MSDQRSIADFHATRVSGTGCPEANGGPHYFAFLDLNVEWRICIDCGAREPQKESER